MFLQGSGRQKQREVAKTNIEKQFLNNTYLINDINLINVVGMKLLKTRNSKFTLEKYVHLSPDPSYMAAFLGQAMTCSGNSLHS